MGSANVVMAVAGVALSAAVVLAILLVRASDARSVPRRYCTME